MAGGVALAPGRRVESVGVRFTPAGLAPLCPFPQARLADRIVRLDGVAGAAACAPWPPPPPTAPTLGDALDALRRELPRAYASTAPLDAAAADAPSRASPTSGGTVPLEALAQAAGASPRWLERHFQAAVGSPRSGWPAWCASAARVAALEANPVRTAGPPWPSTTATTTRRTSSPSSAPSPAMRRGVSSSTGWPS